MTREIKESDARPWIRRVRTTATYIVLVYIGLLVILFTAQGYLIFVPSTEVFVPPEYAAWNMQDVELTVGENSTHGWFVPANGDSRGAVLFSHGNAGNISHRVESIRIFRNLGLDTFIYDYGGYGKSTGSPSEQRCYADIRAAWRYLTESHGIPADQIILFGRSLGGGPTAQLATEVEAAAVILESTYTSIPDMARQQFPIFPVQLLARHRFDTLSKIADINVP
ncbi:MAG: alpha/beta fold hydrolase, partial [Candidatus Hydrogenedentota bacterium]